MSRVFKRGTDFPNEGFVQGAIETHFSRLGYSLRTNQSTDLLCAHPDTGEQWHIEAKGQTSAVGLDFRTGLGQLVQAIKGDSIKYGVAVPDTPQFRAQIAKVSAHVVRLLQLHWLIVSEDGVVHVVVP